MPRAAAQSRQPPLPRIESRAITPRVAAAVTGAAAGAASAGTSVSLRRMSAESVTGISISTVPATVGVNIFRSSESFAASRNWHREETMIRLASNPPPPRSSAVTQMARKALLLPISSR